MTTRVKTAEEIYFWLERRVRLGELKPGDQLEPVRALADRLKVQKNTVQAAYLKLQRSGLTVSLGRNGTVVRDMAAFGTPVQRALPEGVIDLGHGNPASEFLPTQHDLLRVSGLIDAPRAVLYGDPLAHQPLVEWFAEQFAQDELPGVHLTMMGGALDSLDGAMRCFLRRGDAVAVESPCYPAILQLAGLHGLKIVPLPLDAKGATPAGLSRALARGVRALFITSRAQNPTGVSIAQSRGEELARVLRRHRGPLPLLVDDDHFSLLASSPYVPWFSGIATLNWMTARSVSKFLGPDMRLAAVAGDEATVATLRSHSAMTRRWQSHHMQRLAHGLLTDIAVSNRIGEAKAAYRRRREALIGGMLTVQPLAAADIDGLNLWIPSERSGQLDAWLLGRGWAAKTGEHFAALGTAAGLRLTCSALEEAQCRILARDINTYFQTFQ